MIPRGPIMMVAAVTVTAGIAIAGAASWLTWPFGEPSPPPLPPPASEMSEPETPVPEPEEDAADVEEEVAEDVAGIAEDDEFGADWPRTAGWEETAYLCSACHSLAIVKQQGLSRKVWDELLDWMVEEQGMAELAPEEHALVLRYLAQNFGVPETP